MDQQSLFKKPPVHDKTTSVSKPKVVKSDFSSALDNTGKVTTSYTKKILPVKTVTKMLPVELILDSSEKTPIKTLEITGRLPIFDLALADKDNIVAKQIVLNKTDGSSIQLNINPSVSDGELLPLPTISDSDLIKFCLSLVRKNKGVINPENRTVRFTASDYFRFTKRNNSKKYYDELKNTLRRLRANIRIVDSNDSVDSEMFEALSGEFAFIDKFMIYERGEIISSAHKDSQERIKEFTVVVSFSEYIWSRMMADSQVLSLHPDFFTLSTFKKSLYEHVRKLVNNKMFFKVRICKLAQLLGMIPNDILYLNSDELKNARRKIEYLREHVRECIAEDDLLDLRIGIEEAKRNGQELVVFYIRTANNELSESYSHTLKRFFTKLEEALVNGKDIDDRDAKNQIKWFNALLRTEAMKERLSENKRFQRKKKEVDDVIRDGDTNKKMTANKRSLYEFLKKMRNESAGRYEFSLIKETSDL